MQKDILDFQKVKIITIQILKLKNQWKQKQTQVWVSNFTTKNCQVFLIEVNIVSSTMIISENWPRQTLIKNNRPTIFAFRADLQNQGRGQKQNSWQSPKGNLYLTLICSPSLQYFPYLPMICIQKVFNAIQNYFKEHKIGSNVRIKWINDILIDFEKVSGVLIKNELIGQNLITEIGIGINVKRIPQNLTEIKQSVTYLQKHSKQEIDVNKLCRKVIQKFEGLLNEKQMGKLKREGKQNYERNLAFKGRQVLIYDQKYEKVLGQGLFIGINQYGHALIEGYEKGFMEGRMRPQQKVL